MQGAISSYRRLELNLRQNDINNLALYDASVNDTTIAPSRVTCNQVEIIINFLYCHFSPTFAAVNIDRFILHVTWSNLSYIRFYWTWSENNNTLEFKASVLNDLWPKVYKMNHVYFSRSQMKAIDRSVGFENNSRMLKNIILRFSKSGNFAEFHKEYLEIVLSIRKNIIV